MVVNRLGRVWLLMLVAIGALVAQVPAVHAATTTANITPGQLTISPASVTISYNVTRQSRGQALTSGFTVRVTDATGAKVGWQILAATARTVSPQDNFPIDEHAIVDFSVPDAGGTWPDPTCPCGVIPTAFSPILQTPAKTGMGWANVSFQTEFDVPDDAAPGQYTTTLALMVTPPGSVAPMPYGKRAPAPPVVGGSPAVAPGGRSTNPNPGALAPAVSGPPATMPNARSVIPDATTTATTSSVTTTSSAPGKQTTGTTAPANASVAQDDPHASSATAGGAPGAAATNTAVAADPAAAPAPAIPATAIPAASAASVTGGNSPQPSGIAAGSQQVPVPPAAMPGVTVSRAVPPAVVSAPAIVMNGDEVTTQSAFVVDTRDKTATWRLQASLSAPDRDVAAIGGDIAMRLAIFDGDGATATDAQAWALTGTAGFGPLANVAVPQGIGRATLLLDTRVHGARAPASWAGAILTVTIAAGP